MQDDDDEGGRPKVKLQAPAWLLTFADLSTLLLTFLALMLSFSNMDVIEFRQMMGSIEKAFGSSRASTGFYLATTTLEEKTATDGKESSYDKFKTEKATEKMLEKAMGGEGMEVSGGSDGFRVKIDSSFFFQSGKGILKNNRTVREVLKKISILIKKKKYACIVEGYTDSVPMHTAQYPSNIHLASARAQSVTTFLLKQGVPENLIEAHGYGSRFLIYDENGKELKAKSRRVEFVFTDLRDTRFDIQERDDEDDGG